MDDHHPTTPRRPDDPYEGREPKRYQNRLVVTEDDIDSLGHVNNIVYVRWIQDIAGEHWRSAADPEVAEGIAWVLTRHEIDYKRAAHLGDEITVTTWVGSATKVRFERFVEITGAADTLHAKSRTLWSPINRATGRLVRLDISAHEPFYE